MKKSKIRNVPNFKNMKDILYHSVECYPNHTAFTTKIKKEDKVEYINHTYRDLLEDVNAFGTALYHLHLQEKRIAIIGANCYEWAVAHLSSLLGGMVSVPLDKGLQLNELEESLIRSKADAIVFHQNLKDLVHLVQQNGKTNIKYYICMNELENFENMHVLMEEGKRILQEGNKEYIEHEVDSYKMSILLFTSGTTSKSKAVMLNQNGIAVNVSDMLKVETFYDNDTNIAFLPYHHIFGSTCMIVMLAAGVRTVFPDGLKYIKQNLKEYEISVFVGVPVLIDKMYSNIEREIEKQGKTKLVHFGIKISNALRKLHIDVRRKIFKQIIDELGGKMRFVISGGAPLEGGIAQKFNELGIRLVQGYGLTETSPVISAENDYCMKHGSVGVPMESMQLELVNKDEKGIGEIRVKGPNVMLGYYEDEEKTKEVLKDGWFYTGDLGKIDEDGILFITGRKKDMIVLKNGKKVFPEELEILVNRIDEIEESFVYGMPSKEDKNDVKVSIEVVYNEEIVKEKYSNISEEELYKILWEKIKEINKTLPKYKYIKNMILTKEPLIKTTTNKIKRKEEWKKLINKEQLL